MGNYKPNNYQANIIVELLRIREKEGIRSYRLAELLTKPWKIKEEFNSDHDKKCISKLSYNEHYQPSRPHVYATINHLVNNKIIIKKEQIIKNSIKHITYYLSELGFFCITHNYKPHEITKIINISQLILMLAFKGIDHIRSEKLEDGEQSGKVVWIAEESLNNLSPKKKIRINSHLVEYKRGVSIKELFELEYRNISESCRTIQITEEEFTKYIQYMIEKKILKPLYEHDEERYILFDEKIEGFMKQILYMYTDIEQKLEFKIGYLAPTKVDDIEKNWCIEHLGIQKTNDLIILGKQIRKDRKRKNKVQQDKDIKFRENQIKSMNGRLIDLYGSIKNNPENLFEKIPEMKDLIVTRICSDSLIEQIKNEYNELNKVV